MLRSLLVGISIVIFLTSCLQLDDDVVTELKSTPPPDEPEWLFVTKNDGLAEDTVTTMMKDSQGYFWFGHYSKGITRWDGHDEYRKISLENGLTDNYIFRIAEGPDGRIWVATNKGYNILDGATVVAYEFYNYAFTDIAFPKPGSVWLSSQTGIHVFSNAGDSVIRDNGCQFCAPALRLLVDSDDNIWAGGIQDLRRYNAAAGYQVDKRYFLYPRENYTAVFVTEIFEGDDNTIFGGSLYGEFNTFVLTNSEPEFFNFSTASLSGVSAITTYDNQLWVGTRGSGVIQTNGTSLAQFYTELPSPVVFDLLNDGQSIWIATFAGVAKYTAR